MIISINQIMRYNTHVVVNNMDNCWIYVHTLSGETQFSYHPNLLCRPEIHSIVIWVWSIEKQAVKSVDTSSELSAKTLMWNRLIDLISPLAHHNKNTYWYPVTTIWISHKLLI